MKTLLIDAVGLAGLGCLAAGVHLQFGPGPALIVAGAVLLLVALAAARRKGAAWFSTGFSRAAAASRIPRCR